MGPAAQLSIHFHSAETLMETWNLQRPRSNARGNRHCHFLHFTTPRRETYPSLLILLPESTKPIQLVLLLLSLGHSSHIDIYLSSRPAEKNLTFLRDYGHYK